MCLPRVKTDKSLAKYMYNIIQQTFNIIILKDNFQKIE